MKSLGNGWKRAQEARKRAIQEQVLKFEIEEQERRWASHWAAQAGHTIHRPNRFFDLGKDHADPENLRALMGGWK